MDFGLIREKFLKIADGIWSGWVGFWSGDEHAVHREEITNVADYLEEMGYDLVNYGFLDTDGKQVKVDSGENGEETIKNYKNKVILKREVDKDTGELKIKKIRSECIETYLTAENLTYTIANQNKSVSSIWNNLWDDSGDDDHKKANWGTGMIYIEGMSEDTANSLGASSDAEWGKSKNVKIDRENKKLVITKDKHVYQYSLEGWAGRYGKSLEFLLTLHLATMAPDFACDVATLEEFDTKVHVALYEVDTSIEIVYKIGDGEYAKINESNYSNYGLSGDQWQAIKEYNNDNLTTYTPLITKVTNHWFKNLDFANCYAEVENDPNTTDDDEKFTYYYQYVGLGEEDDVLAKDENIYVREVRKKDIYQISEPKVIDNSGQIKKMLLGSTDEKDSENTNPKYKYYIYTGSPMAEGQDERNKDYIIKKVEFEDKQMGYTMNTRTFTYAFAILESVHSEDAEYVLRDLKELFREIGIKADELNPDQGSTEEVIPLTWPIKDYKPIVWDPIYDAETSKVSIKHKTESTLGFDKGIDFIMPADGEIIQITKGEKDENGNTTGDSIKIRFTGTSNRKDLEDMCIYISGIKVDDNISNGSIYSKEQKIGETIDRDIIIIMSDSQRKSIPNVDQYLQPEKWDFETADEITESNFGNDIFGNNGGNSSPYIGTFSEEFYWYLATLEGMPVTSDMNFTRSNGGVVWLGGESGITVGPGIFMASNVEKFRQYGYYFNTYDVNQVFPKDVTIAVYKQDIDEIKQYIETKMNGYTLSQNQMEALVITAYQRGVYDSNFNQILEAIKNKKSKEEIRNIWTYSTGNYVQAKQTRRYAEWYLFTYGKYIDKDSGREIQFSSPTPFTDMINGIQSGH